MIYTCLSDAARYEGLNPHFRKAFDFLRRTDLASLTQGWHEVDGETVYAMVVQEPLRRAEDAELEAHRNYIDLQMCLEGQDRIGWRSLATCGAPSMEYDAEQDIMFFADRPEEWLDVLPGRIAIFFPEDGHLPLVGEGMVSKVVVKVREVQGMAPHGD